MDNSDIKSPKRTINNINALELAILEELMKLSTAQKLKLLMLLNTSHFTGTF